MSTPEPNFETVSVEYDRRRLMWGFPYKDDPKLFLWVSVELMNDAPHLFISQMIWSKTGQKVTQSQIKFLSNYDSSIILPVVSRVVFEYPEAK